MVNYISGIANNCATIRRLRSHKFAVHGADMEKPPQPAEGRLIKTIISSTPDMTIRRLAEIIDLSEARIRQYINGYTSAGRGQFVTVEIPADRLVSIARALTIGPERLEAAGRPDAAEALRAVEIVPPDFVWPADDDDVFELKMRRPDGMSVEEWKRRTEEYREEFEWKIRRAAGER